MIVIRSLGAGEVVAAETAAIVSHTTPEVLERNVLAAGVLLSGLGAAFTLVLFATGRHKEAYAAGIGSALVSAVVGAVRVLSGEH